MKLVDIHFSVEFHIRSRLSPHKIYGHNDGRIPKKEGRVCVFSRTRPEKNRTVDGRSQTHPSIQQTHHDAVGRVQASSGGDL